MASSSSLPLLCSPSSLPQTWKHHVFPSFHGPDVRRTFLGHIMKVFRSKAIDVFIDNNIERSKSIGPELVEAITGSRIAIVLLSKNYASSTWCLDELVEIIKCREEKLGKTVMVIFYEVDPSHVKKQIGDFGKVFRETCEGKTKDIIGKWEQALTEVAQIAGYDSRNWNNEAEMIEEIATDVSNKLNNSTPSSDFNSLVGMESRRLHMESLLLLDSEEVRIIGVWGPSGIGKTTIARFLFNQLSKDFQLSVFMENIRATYPKPARSDDYSVKKYLQEQFMSQITNQKDFKIRNLGSIEDWLKDKKVLVVLDDVNQLVQLEAMAKETRWFGPWSRIIITTQDQQLLRRSGINHIYKVDFPSSGEALEMFCMYAFDQKFPKDGFEELAWKVIELVGSLPLGLKVIGSYFRGMYKEEWKRALPRLLTRLDGEIESILKFSYDALYDEDQNLFLHIACLFNHENGYIVEGCLAKSFSDVKQGLRVLVEKSLISIDWGKIEMHNLLVQLGRGIARKQSSEPGKRQFLVDEGDIREVLTDDKADSSRVIGINLNLSDDNEKDIICTSKRAFERLSNLQFLIIDGIDRNKYHDVTKKNFPQILNYISGKLKMVIGSKFEKLWDGIQPLNNLKWINLSYSKRLKELLDNGDGTNLYFLQILNSVSVKLRYLSWEHFPMPCLPPSFHPKYLVKLDMRYSKLEKLWEGIQPLHNLKWMNLSYSPMLKELCDLSTATNLDELDLNKCSSLVKLPSSIGNAINLKKLNLCDCSSLVKLPSSIGNAIILQELNLRYCSSLVELPFSIGNAINFKELNLIGCSSLVELPSSIGNAINLEELYLSKCSSLVKLPSSIGNAINLRELHLKKCISLVELPSSIGNAINLQRLVLIRCTSLVKLPSSIGNAINLRELHLKKCISLVELPSSIENAINLQRLVLIRCTSLVKLPSSIGNAINLRELHLKKCISLVELPSSIGNAINLQSLVLIRCTSLVKLPSSIGNATNLQYLDLSHCSSLVELPSSIWNAINLKYLYLIGCSSLVELSSSIGNATNLQILNLRECSSLVELPSPIGNVCIHLRELDLRGCSSLVKLPCSIGNATNLQYLDLRYCSSLVELPCSIGNATNLQRLDLRYCSSLVLPSSIENATNLKELDLRECTSLVKLPSSIGNATNLNKLYLGYFRSLVGLPSSIGHATNLQELDLNNCSNLKELPSSIGNAINLKDLNLHHCSNLVKLPSSIGNAINLKWLDLRYCSSLVELPKSIGNAIKLKYLGLTECSSLVELPSPIENACIHIDELDLRGCSSLVKLPSSIGNAVNLEKLDLDDCSSLVELPSTMKNLCRLSELVLRGCSKLDVILTNINMESLEELDLSFCSSLKCDPENSANINEDLEPSGTTIQELGPWIGRISRLSRLVLRGMKNMVSLPQLPYSITKLDASNCTSLERLDCTFLNPDISLDFAGCYKLNQEARDLIIHTPNNKYAVLPGREVPECFTYRASGSCLTVKLNQKPLHRSTKFKACIIFAGKYSRNYDDGGSVDCSITSNQNALTACTSNCIKIHPLFQEHLYIFEVEAVNVTSTELVFDFHDHHGYGTEDWEIKECGILQLLEVL